MSTIRKLSARSVIASTLLGVRPPELAGAVLVRSGGLFGIGEAATRTALHRMAAAGEVVADDGRYRLAGRLGARQAHLDEGRAGAGDAHWDGRWVVAVIRAQRARPAPERAALRRALHTLRLAELREGVWVRPDNLPADRHPNARSLVDAATHRFLAEPAGLDPRELWDLASWASEAARLHAELRACVTPLEAGDLQALAPAFLLDAEILRHFQADPLLPPALVPPRWPAAALRADYERLDRAVKGAWTRWYRAVRAGAPRP